jgi:pyridoxamine 5'-phosphate oxidase
MLSKIEISHLRKDYKLRSLSESDVQADPINQFQVWWHEAVQSEISEVNAMSLATASKEGLPSVRIVLIKGFSEEGFTFYTNYNSKKGQQLAENPNACLLFFWKELERQVKIEGVVEKLPIAESDAYFQSRPRESKLGAWASSQSSVIPGREVLEERLSEYADKFPAEVPRPQGWGGYVLKPAIVEFWQGRPSRLHDRIQYSRNDEGSWMIQRLAP